MLELMGRLTYDWHGCVATCVAELLSYGRWIQFPFFFFSKLFLDITFLFNKLFVVPA